MVLKRAMQIDQFTVPQNHRLLPKLFTVPPEMRVRGWSKGACCRADATYNGLISGIDIGVAWRCSHEFRAEAAVFSRSRPRAVYRSWGVIPAPAAEGTWCGFTSAAEPYELTCPCFAMRITFGIYLGNDIRQSSPWRGSLHHQWA